MKMANEKDAPVSKDSYGKSSQDYISHDQMEYIVAHGGSVLHNGRLITSANDLPTKLELATGDPEAEKAARAEMEADIARKQAQLDASKKASEAAPADQVPAENTDKSKK
jgi:hypothetical protein